MNAPAASDPSHEGRQRLRGAFAISVARIRSDPAQPRRTFDAADLAELADSIRARGILQPIRVWYVASENAYQIIAGERRFRAAEAAGLEAIPCIVEDVPAREGVLPRKTILVDQIVENWQRSDLNPYELSDALAELRDTHDYSQKQIARMTGKPESEVSRLLSLQNIDAAIQQQVRGSPSGSFSRRHLIALAQLPAEEQRRMAETVQESKLTAVETERAAATMRKRSRGKPSERAAGAIRRFATPKATVTVSFRKGEVTDDDVLEVLRKVQAMVEQRIDE
ncbi:MAG: ParB/RepB/Spo0J family partition protein [Planctomycetes bacterium]|nr:ParB/RepB/Spo0J family partition protein [Planctomycetota bacterium]